MLDKLKKSLLTRIYRVLQPGHREMQEVLFAPNNDMLLQSNHVNSNSVRVDIIINNTDVTTYVYKCRFT